MDRKCFVTLLGSCCLTLSLHADDRAESASLRSRYIDVEHGFSIDLPRFPRASSGQFTLPLCLYVEPRQAWVERWSGYVHAVDLRVVETRSSVRSYQETTLADLRKEGWKIDRTRDLRISGRPAWMIDYHGKLIGIPPMRCRALYVFRPERVFELVCEAEPERFKRAEAQFQACLESFRLSTDDRTAELSSAGAGQLYIDRTSGFSVMVPHLPPALHPSDTIPAIFVGVVERGVYAQVQLNIHSYEPRTSGHARFLKARAKNGWVVNKVEAITVADRGALWLDYNENRNAPSLRLRHLDLLVFDEESDRVIHVSCLCPVAEFPRLEPEFRACLGSFRLIPRSGSY